jgi:hypothetical protein
VHDVARARQNPLLLLVEVAADFSICEKGFSNEHDPWDLDQEGFLKAWPSIYRVARYCPKFQEGSSGPYEFESTKWVMSHKSILFFRRFVRLLAKYCRKRAPFG